MKTNIKAFRKARRLTQDELAALIGETKRVISSWEREEAQITLESACKLADVFDCTLDELVGRKSPTVPSYHDPLQEQMNGCYESMNETGRKLAADSVRAMSSSPELRMVKEREDVENKAAMGA